MTPEQFRALRSRIGTELGFGGLFAPFDGSPAGYEALDPADRIRLTNALADYIRTHPAAFDPVQIAVAARVDIAPPETYGAADAFGDFFGEVGAQASDLNQTLNPFSARNRGWVLGVVAVGVILYFAGPAIVAALRAPVKAAAKAAK